MARFYRLSVLACTGVMALAIPAHAGFEFTPPAAAVAVPEPTESQMPEAPMPILPTAPVTAEPLQAPDTPIAAPATGAVPAAAPVVSAPASSEPVYIRRQRSTIPMKAPKSEPMDTAALLKATENSEPVALTQHKIDQMPAKQSGKLVINPYPLEEVATHNAGGMGKLSVEQAMMEEGGALRPIATPGKSDTGLRARAKISSRYDQDVQYLDRRQMAADAAMDETMASGILTPIPGGEGEPLSKIERQPLSPPARISPQVPVAQASQPRPAVPANYPTPLVQQQLAPAPAAQAQAGSSGYTEAVGFGRDLPLALALSQVVPPEYSYAFAQNVNVGSTVSWEGGKPWNEVLNDMLAPNGMRAVISGTQVTIQSAQS